MPYKTLEDPSGQVKNNLPKDAREIYLKAFESTWGHYKEPEKRRGRNQGKRLHTGLSGPQLNKSIEKENQENGRKSKIGGFI